MEMTARELHDLYAPLWERAPKTKPAGLEYRDLVVQATNFGPHFMADNQGPVTDAIAAALCRVAVEDWLSSVGWFTILLRKVPREGKGAWDVTFEAYCVSERAYECKTIHHALVAAALAVADQPEAKR